MRSCLACSSPLPPPAPSGRPRKTCNSTCRHRLYRRNRDARIAANAIAAALADHGIAA